MRIKVKTLKNIVILLFIVIISFSFLKIVKSTENKVVVLNKQEYPRLHENWTVNFKTSGTADLIIEGVKGDYANLYDDTNKDLELLELKCGEEIVFNKDLSLYKNIVFGENRVTVSGYSCPEVSSWTVRLLECSKHRQHFVFGESEDYADNACEGTDTFTLVVTDPDEIQIQKSTPQAITPVGGIECDDGPNTVATFDNITCQKAGDYTAQVTCAGCTHDPVGSTTVLSCGAPGDNKFVIQNSTGGNVAAINDKGTLYLKGKNYSNAGTLNPPPGSFMIKDNGGTVVAYINQTGDLLLKGRIDQNQSNIAPQPSSFIIRNSSANVATVAYINSDGNMNLTGWIYEQWLDPI